MLARNLMTVSAGGVSVVSYSSGRNTSSTTLTINKPTGIVSGDVLVAVMGCGYGGGTTWTGDTGWTERLEAVVDSSLRIATLTAGGSEPASYTFTAASSASDLFGIILAARGAQFDVVAAAANTLGGNGALAISGLTAAGGLLIAGITTRINTSAAHSTPSGMQATTTINGTFNGGAASLFFEAIGAGATGTRTSTLSSTSSGGSAGALIALKPA